MSLFENKSIGLVLLLVVLGGVSAAWLKPTYRDFDKRAQANYAKSAASMVITTQNNYKKEFGEYSLSMDSTGYTPDPKIEKIYMKFTEIPDKVLAGLKDEDLPSVDKDHFRILLQFQKEGKNKSGILWLVSETGESRQVIPIR